MSCGLGCAFVGFQHERLVITHRGVEYGAILDSLVSCRWATLTVIYLIDINSSPGLIQMARSTMPSWSLSSGGGGKEPTRT
jgi:hypothetical protein